MKIFTLKCAGLALSLLIGFNTLGDTVIYNSYTPSYTPISLSNGQEIGNEITLNANVTLTGFNFEYYTPTTFSSSGVTVNLTLYANDGPLFNGYATPGSILFSSGPSPALAAAPGGLDVIYDTSDFGANFVLPKDFTFTLTFQGLVGTDVINLLLGAPPTGQLATTTPDYWYNTNSPASFELLTLGANSSVIGAEFTGNVKASDSPMTAGLLGLGFVGMFAFRRKFSPILTIKN